MNLPEIVGAIPELFLFIVPGYIAIKIREKYNLEKQTNSLDTVLHCVVYSFVVQIVYSIILFFFSRVNKSSYMWFGGEVPRQIAHLVLAVILGYILIKIPETSPGRFIAKLFNKNLAPYSSVWIKAMKNDAGAWATVYLKNGLIYTGMLINYTSDPNEGVKEILLTNYRLCVQNTKPDITPENFYTVIIDHTDNQVSRVLLERGNILSIEISD